MPTCLLRRGNGRFERRAVKIGRDGGRHDRDSGGIQAGETIVSEGALFLRVGGQG